MIEVLINILSTLRRGNPKSDPDVLTSATAATDKVYKSLYMLTDANVAISSFEKSGAALVATDVSAGIVILGTVKHSNLTIASGTVLAYTD